MIIDGYYLILKHAFTGRFRAVAGAHCETMDDIRRVVISALRDARFVREYACGSGRVKLFDVRLRGVAGVCRIGLTFGTDRFGVPLPAPDGKKKLVFASSFAHYPDK